MQFSTLILPLLLTLATACPFQTRQLGGLCGSGLDTPQCCDVSVGGVANLNCASPSTDPKSITALKAECNAQGQAPYCCVLPVLGDALVCSAL